MQQVLITSLPTENRGMAPNLRTTVARRSCDLPELAVAHTTRA